MKNKQNFLKDSKVMWILFRIQSLLKYFLYFGKISSYPSLSIDKEGIDNMNLTNPRNNGRRISENSKR